MKTIIFIIVVANATCPSKCGWKIFDGDDKIASVDALTFAGTDEQKELMDVFDQDTYTRFNLTWSYKNFECNFLRWRSLKEDGTKMWFRVKFKQVVKIKKISFTNRAEAKYGENYK